MGSFFSKDVIKMIISTLMRLGITLVVRILTFWDKFYLMYSFILILYFLNESQRHKLFPRLTQTPNNSVS